MIPPLPPDLRPSLLRARANLDAFMADAPSVEALHHACQVLALALRQGNKVLVCGNGGSNADAGHFAEELTARFRADRPALAAVACTDAGHITCAANDFGFDRVFSRWVEALGKPGDALVVLSTSGNSANILLALEAAHARGLRTVALLGRGGGRAAGLAHAQIVAPGDTADRVQEIHHLVLHVWVEGIEKALGLA